MDCSLSVSSVCRVLQQEYWGGQLFPSPRDLPDPRVSVKMREGGIGQEEGGEGVRRPRLA